jgi:hypothetical protein
VSEPRPRYQTVPLTQPLRWDAWIKHLWENSPSRFFDPAEQQAWLDAYWQANPRLEAKQWRRAGTHAVKIEGTKGNS